MRYSAFGSRTRVAARYTSVLIFSIFFLTFGKSPLARAMETGCLGAFDDDAEEEFFVAKSPVAQIGDPGPVVLADLGLTQLATPTASPFPVESNYVWRGGNLDSSSAQGLLEAVRRGPNLHAVILQDDQHGVVRFLQSNGVLVHGVRDASGQSVTPMTPELAANLELYRTWILTGRYAAETAKPPTPEYDLSVTHKLLGKLGAAEQKAVLVNTFDALREGGVAVHSMDLSAGLGEDPISRAEALVRSALGEDRHYELAVFFGTTLIHKTAMSPFEGAAQLSAEAKASGVKTKLLGRQYAQLAANRHNMVRVVILKKEKPVAQVAQQSPYSFYNPWRWLGY